MKLSIIAALFIYLFTVIYLFISTVIYLFISTVKKMCDSNWSDDDFYEAYKLSDNVTNAENSVRSKNEYGGTMKEGSLNKDDGTKKEGSLNEDDGTKKQRSLNEDDEITKVRSLNEDDGTTKEGSLNEDGITTKEGSLNEDGGTTKEGSLNYDETMKEGSINNDKKMKEDVDNRKDGSINDANMKEGWVNKVDIHRKDGSKSSENIFTAQQEAQSSDSENDDVPLARFANKHYKNKKESRSPSPEYDDTDKDETYSPSASSSESDSERPVIINLRKRKWWRKRNRPLKRMAEQNAVRNKPRKTISSNKTKRNSTKTSKANENESDISKAQEASLEIFNINQIRKRGHIRRLNHLLSSNNLTLIQTDSDGDCFFNAIRCQISTENYTASTLRAYVCDHLMKNENSYIEFLQFSDDLSPEQKSQAYSEKVQTIETAGIWNNDISDIVPVAVANIFNTKSTIFSSRVHNPVTNIEPTMGTSVTADTRKPFMLSFLAMRGFEHYDCVIKSPSTTNHGHFASGSKQNTQQAPPQRSPTVTPRKKADYKSPEKKKKSRKKTSNPSKWRKNIRKENKNMGKSYISPANKKLVPAKCLKPMDCTACRYKCSTKVSQVTRQNIFDHYYSPQMTYERKRDFICRHIEVKPTSKRNLRTYKLNSRTYTLPVGDKLVRVCKQFFLKTLDISDKLVRCTLAK